MNNLIITTEKDYVRLKSKKMNNLYFLPVKSTFLSNDSSFNSLVIEYIIKF